MLRVEENGDDCTELSICALVLMKNLHFSIEGSFVYRVLARQVQLELDRFEQLFLAIVQVEDELSFIELHLEEWQLNVCLRCLEISITVAIQLHLVRVAHVLVVKCYGALLAPNLAQLCALDCLCPVLATIRVIKAYIEDLAECPKAQQAYH